MQFALDYLIPFPCNGVWRQNLVSLFFLMLLFSSHNFSINRVNQYSRKPENIQRSGKWFVIQNNHNLEHDILINFCYLMVHLLSRRNDLQLWRSIGILLFSKTWISVCWIAPFCTPTTLWSTRKYGSRNNINSSLIKDYNRWNGRCEKPNETWQLFFHLKQKRVCLLPCHFLQLARSLTRFYSGSFQKHNNIDFH